MAAAQLLSADRQNHFARERSNSRTGHLADKDKVYSFGPLPQMPIVQNLVTKGLDTYAQAVAASKPTSMQQLTNTQRAQIIQTRTKTYAVSPSTEPALSISKKLLSGTNEVEVSEDLLKSQMSTLQDESAKVSKGFSDLKAVSSHIRNEKQTLQKHLLRQAESLSKEAAKLGDINTEIQLKGIQRDLKKDHLKDVEDVVTRFDNVLKRMIKLNEDRANDIYRQLDDRTKKIERITQFQQKLNIALAQKDANGAVDWTNNEEMRKLTDEMRALGIEIPPGHNWTAQEVSLVKSNADMIKSSLQNLSKMLQTDMSEVSQRLNNLYMILSSLWKALFDILMRIAQRMGE